LEQLTIGLEGLPNDAELWEQIGYVHRRQGNWDEAIAAFEKAAQLNPRDGDLLADLGAGTLMTMHRYAEAVRAYDRALTLAPDLHVYAVMKGQTHVLWHGRLDTLRTVLRRVPRDADLSFLGTGLAQRALILYWERRADSLLQMLSTAPGRAFDAADFFLPTSLYAAWAHRLRGDASSARAAFDSARVLVDSVIAARPMQSRGNWRLHAARGLALAGLSRRDDALREARWLEESLVYRQDALHRPLLAENRARILAQAGEAGAALDVLERLLEQPAKFSVHMLRIEPIWDPIREHPRFRALLAKYGN
jgi:tetratricopeptide (TPR) repeat protein